MSLIKLFDKAGKQYEFETELRKVIIDVPVYRKKEVVVEHVKVVEKEIKVIIPKFVDKMVERPVLVDVKVNRAIFKDKVIMVPKLVFKNIMVDKPVYVNKVITIEKPVIKEKIVTVEKIVYKEVIIERPVYRDKVILNPTYKEVEIIVPVIREQPMTVKEALAYQKKKKK